MRPSVGLMKPSSALSIVLLPAPFGPSRPTAPRAKRALTPFSARFAAVDDRHVVELDDRRRHPAGRVRVPCGDDVCRFVSQVL